MDYVVVDNNLILNDEENNMSNDEGSTYRLFNEEEKHELTLQALSIPRS